MKVELHPTNLEEIEFTLSMKMTMPALDQLCAQLTLAGRDIPNTEMRQLADFLGNNTGKMLYHARQTYHPPSE